MVSNIESHQLDVPSLVAILKVSRLWMVENSIQWVVDHLNELDLSPAHKLELARMYTIPQWVAPAIRTLILSPLSIISEDDTHRLGLRVYSIIAKAHEVMDTERRTLAAVPPGLSLGPSTSCNATQHSQCRDAWAKFWWQKVARQLLHPVSPLALSGVVEYVATQAHPISLNMECKEEIIGQAVDSGALDAEDQIIGGAVEAVQQYFVTL